jgi:adenosylhomocysteine nucleosidase
VAGCVLTWHELVHDGQLKEQLRARFGADCVDMETGYVARLCTARGVPFLAVRGISDRADETVAALDRADVALAIWHATMVAVEAIA